MSWADSGIPTLAPGHAILAKHFNAIFSALKERIDAVGYSDPSYDLTAAIGRAIPGGPQNWVDIHRYNRARDYSIPYYIDTTTTTPAVESTDPPTHWTKETIRESIGDANLRTLDFGHPITAKWVLQQYEILRRMIWHPGTFQTLNRRRKWGSNNTPWPPEVRSTRNDSNWAPGALSKGWLPGPYEEYERKMNDYRVACPGDQTKQIHLIFYCVPAGGGTFEAHGDPVAAYKYKSYASATTAAETYDFIKAGDGPQPPVIARDDTIYGWEVENPSSTLPKVSAYVNHAVTDGFEFQGS